MAGDDGEAQALGGESTDLDSSQDTAETVELLAAKATLAQHILTLKKILEWMTPLSSCLPPEVEGRRRA